MRHYVMTLMYIYWYNNVEGQIYEKLNEMISETMIPELTLSFLELKDWMHIIFNTDQFDVYVGVQFIDRRAGVDIHPHSPAFLPADMMDFITQEKAWLQENNSTDSDSSSDDESPSTQRKRKRQRRRY